MLVNGSTKWRAENYPLDVAIWRTSVIFDKSIFHGVVGAKARLGRYMRERKGRELKLANADNSLEKFCCHEEQRNKGKYRKLGSR